MARRSPRLPQPPRTTSGSATAPAPDEAEEEVGRWLGERLRRVALGLTAALITARAYWPSEYSSELDTGRGLIWVLAVLVVAGLGIAAMLIGGVTRVRWSWTDAAVYTLMLLVGLSSTRGAERRVAINLAWEWGGLGVAYALVRCLPRTRGESSALAGALVATAVAVSTYGLYQVAFEFPEMNAAFQRDPRAMLKQVGVDPDSPMAGVFGNRLLGSNEPFATFALANSLAGFLVGPLVLALAVGLDNLRREGAGPRLAALAGAAVPGLILLICFVLTKSRSAYLGLLVGLAVLAWRRRRGLSARTLALAGGTLLAVVALLVAAGLATRHLDVLVLSESPKSLRYRWEYWQGTWEVIRQEPGVFWKGLGPGNFAGPYLRHKLPWASEEVRDPHNLLLETWATAGLWAVLMLSAALFLALRDVLGPPRPPRSEGDGGPAEARVDLEEGSPPSGRGRGRPRPEDDAPPARSHWLVASAGMGWLLVAVLGELNPFRDELLLRWLVLGAGWLGCVLLGASLWRRRPIPADGLGAGALALAIHLLAAGGIGFPSVALALWMLVALGQNLREDRPCGRQRVGGRGLAFALALVWAALVGSFAGAIGPFWKSEAAMAQAAAALRALPPQFERARDEYARAAQLDRASVSPWLALLDTEYQFWLAQKDKDDKRFWELMTKTLDDASRRNPESLDIEKRRAAIAREVLARSGDRLSPADVIRLEAQIVAANRVATRLYPTSAILHAELAEASAGIGDTVSAAQEAEEALRLDKLTPHLDKKLPDTVRKRLEAELPRWSRKKAPAIGTPAAPKAR